MASAIFPEATAMQLTHFSIDVDRDGIATVLMDVQDEPVNTISPKVEGDLQRVIERLENDAGILAVVFGSKKKDNFIAGADIEAIRAVSSAQEASRLSAELQKGLNRLEALHQERGKPVVAAVHGS